MQNIRASASPQHQLENDLEGDDVSSRKKSWGDMVEEDEAESLPDRLPIRQV